VKRLLLFFVMLTCLLIILSGCNGKNKNEKPKEQIVPVTAAKAVMKDVPVILKEIGTVEPYSAVSVMSMVGGEITHVYIKDGEDVRKGEILFQIDQRPFDLDIRQQEANLAKAQAIVKQSEANLLKDMALFKNAQVELKRNQALFEGGVVSQDDLDKIQTNLDTLDATVQSDKEIIRTNEEEVRVTRETISNSKLQKSYTEIRSPINGRAGDIIINGGNVIKANDRPLVCINQVTPAYVTFDIPEDSLILLKQSMAKGKLQIKAYIDNEPVPEIGTLTFTDNAVNRTTGTIRLKGLFPNPTRKLWPGLFINVELVLSTQKDAIVIPSQAITNGQQGQYVYVVKPDSSVESHPIIVDRNLGTEAIISKGVQAGDTVVTDGQVRILPKSKVKIINAESKAK